MFKSNLVANTTCADPEMNRGSGPLLKNHKTIGLLCNTGLDHLKNHKASKPAFNVGPSSARKRNAISMAFRWRANDGPIKAVFGSSIPASTTKVWTPSDKTFWIRAYTNDGFLYGTYHITIVISCYISFVIRPFLESAEGA